MTMKTVKVVEATERQLDWLVAYAQGRTPTLNMNSHGRVWHGWWLATGGEYERMPNYSNDWAQGGPIIEREGLCVGRKQQCDTAYCPINDPTVDCWARTPNGGHLSYGPTPLIAALRCYVAGKLGESVEVPEELFA